MKCKLKPCGPDEIFSFGITWQSREEAFCLVFPCLISSSPIFPRGLTSPEEAGLTAQDGKDQELWVMEMLPEHLQGVLKVWGRKKYPRVSQLCQQWRWRLTLLQSTLSTAICARPAANYPNHTVSMPWLLTASVNGCLLALRLQV